MGKKQFQLNGYASLFGNPYETFFIYLKFGDTKHYSKGGLGLNSLNTKLVNKIVPGGQLLSGSNYAFRLRSRAREPNFEYRLIELLVGQRVFTHWIDEGGLTDSFRLQSFLVSGLLLDQALFYKLSGPLYNYIQNNVLLAPLGRNLNFLNNFKMYLIFPVISFTFLNFLKLLAVPLKTTFSFIGFIKNNKKIDL